MDITERLKEIVLFETGIDVNKNSRKAIVVETRALYFKLLKEYNVTLTLEQIGETVNKNHATVIHSLRKYDMYEKYNSDLKYLKKIIRKQIDENNLKDTNDNQLLKLKIKKLKNNIDSLELKLQELEIKNKAIHKYKIISNLENLMIETEGTEKQELIKVRLEAFYDMNKTR